MKYWLKKHSWDAVMQSVRYSLMNLDRDDEWCIEIKKHKQQRTLDQNSKFHAMTQELGEAIGYTCEEMKRLTKHELGFYSVVQGPVGKIARLDSSADWNTEKMSRAIEQLNIWAIEVGHRWSAEHE